MSANSVELSEEEATFHFAAVNFFHLRLLQLANDCQQEFQSSLANRKFIKELKKKVENVLHQIDVACSSSPDAPQMNDFEVLRLIGKGGFGSVSIVSHKETGQRFAMKAIQHEFGTNPYLGMERSILTVNDSPFIISMHCSFETLTERCIVMELMEGGDCESLLYRNGPLPLDLARLYVAETTLALEYLHGYGIVHSDLKPANMLIGSNGHIKVADFGLARLGLFNMTTNLKEEGALENAVSEFSNSQVAGTSPYVPPEMILKRGYGKPTDWWALGVTLYQFMMAELPFYALTEPELFRSIVNDAVRWPPHVKQEARDIVDHLLSKNPLHRLGTGGAKEVKGHPFFGNTDWNTLLNQEVPWVVGKMTAQPNEAQKGHTSFADIIDVHKHEPAEERPLVDDGKPVLSPCEAQMEKEEKTLQEYKEEVSRLNGLLKLKDQEVTEASVYVHKHMEVLKDLDKTKAALRELENDLNASLESTEFLMETMERQQEEAFRKEQRVKEMLEQREEQFRRELEEQRLRFEQELLHRIEEAQAQPERRPA